MMQQQSFEEEFVTFEDFVVQMAEICGKFGIQDPFVYGTPRNLWTELVCRFPTRLLCELDKHMGDDYLSDDILGFMHQAIRQQFFLRFDNGIEKVAVS